MIWRIQFSFKNFPLASNYVMIIRLCVKLTNNVIWWKGDFHIFRFKWSCQVGNKRGGEAQYCGDVTVLVTFSFSCFPFLPQIQPIKWHLVLLYTCCVWQNVTFLFSLSSLSLVVLSFKDSNQQWKLADIPWKCIRRNWHAKKVNWSHAPFFTFSSLSQLTTSGTPCQIS